MNQISNEALLFLEEAKQSFIDNPKWSTYRSKVYPFIGLRGGFREDCISVYELGSEVGQFTEVLPRQHLAFVEYDELEKYKDLVDRINLTIEVRSIFEVGAYDRALNDILKELNKINLEVK